MQHFTLVVLLSLVASISAFSPSDIAKKTGCTLNDKVSNCAKLGNLNKCMSCLDDAGVLWAGAALQTVTPSYPDSLNSATFSTSDCGGDAKCNAVGYAEVGKKGYILRTNLRAAYCPTSDQVKTLLKKKKVKLVDGLNTCAKQAFTGDGFCEFDYASTQCNDDNLSGMRTTRGIPVNSDADLTKLSNSIEDGDRYAGYYCDQNMAMFYLVG